MKTVRIILVINGLFLFAMPIPGRVTSVIAADPPAANSSPPLMAGDNPILAYHATNALRDLASARKSMAQRDISGAQRELGQGLIVVNRMKSRFQTLRLAELVAGTRIRLTYQDPEQVLAYLRMVAPSFADLPTGSGALKKEVQAKLARAETALKNNDKDATDRELAALMDALAYDSSARPVSLAEKHILAAASALDKQNSPVASREVSAAESNLNVIAFGSYLPLSQTQKSLAQALLDTAAARTTDAKASLQRASRALVQALKTVDLKGRQELENLNHDIGALLASSAQSGEKLGSSIKHLWERGEALTERALDYETAAWGKFQSSSPGGKDLIEAKLHVAFAEIYEFTTRDAMKSETELNQAEAYLNKASPELSAADKNTVGMVLKEVKQTKAELGEDQPEQRARYEAIKEKLSVLIR